MWEPIIQFVLDKVGVPGLLIIGLGIALYVVWRKYEVQCDKYEVLVKSQQEQTERLVLETRSQAEKCRLCKEESETRHDQNMGEYYNTMREENRRLWDRTEQTLNRLADGLAPLVNRISELSGKLNGIGRYQ